MSRPVLRTTARGRQGPRGPQGPDGPKGLPATNAAEDDAAIAAFASTPGTETNTALNNTIEAATDPLTAANINDPGSATRAALVDDFVPREDLTPVGVWQAYTPTFSNVTGVTFIYARYALIGKTCRVQFRGTLSVAPTGNYRVSLPFPAYASHPVLRDGAIGVANLTTAASTSGTAHATAVLHSDRATVMFFTASPTLTNDYWNDTKPVAWDSTMVLGFSCEYEIA